MSLSGQTTQEQNRPPEKVGNSHWALCMRREHFSYLAPPGATKNFDQNCLVHTIWKKLVELNTCVWIQRVPTKDNISDLPSRWPSFEFVCILCLCRLHCSQGRVPAVEADQCRESRARFGCRLYRGPNMGCFVRLGCFLPLVGQVRRRTVNAGELCARAVTETIHCSVFSVCFYSHRGA